MSILIRAVTVYTFLRYCNMSTLEKEVLDCGAGGDCPPLSVFHEHGYKTHGIDISESQLDLASKFCHEKGIDLNIVKGDMRSLSFQNESLSFVYSFNSIFHMTKSDIALSMKEIDRVLKPGGLCLVNFLSTEDEWFGKGDQIGEGEYLQDERSEKVIHSYFGYNEADRFFVNYEILRKEKRTIELYQDGGKYIQSYIDYIAKKKDRL